MKNERHVRKIAANEVIADNNSFQPGVIELIGDEVVCAHMLDSEQAQTEWLGGILEIKKDINGHLIVYHNNKPITIKQ